MTLPTTLKFPQMLVLVGNGLLPQTFAAPCGLTARTFALNQSGTDVPLVGDEWNRRLAGLLSCKLSGSGLLDAGSFPTWNDWFLSRQSKDVQISLDGLGTYEGAFYLTSFTWSSPRSSRVAIDISLESDGAVEWEDE